MNQVPPTGPEDVIAAVDRTPYGEILRDESRRRQMVFEAMMAGPDPIGREIGQQLRSGNVTPQDLLALPDYQEYFSRARADAERLDLDELAASARTLADEEKVIGDLERDSAIGSTDPLPAGDELHRSENR